MSLALLKQQLAEIVDGPKPESGSGLSTGIRALDELLVGGGVPRGRLTEIVGARGSGKTTLVRLLAEQTVGQAVASRMSMPSARWRRRTGRR